ncbi:twin-arginine translocase TatA/TatE family subunit [Protaetiibacter mangrovi]|uniref:Sec-independent protein translocase protein TatA n=1 Tax=Protaetiibacter mangrovi TaxID=2970926 RepID=A0ABT1ZC69_9MICO|nr:twin-arginine translocase TatA/TatE family subunit [Protaetiibacter mangrovi]MCS0498308.1 twin-arginine translocase TatA/TatE family subunit [Protaetiibacter mangrovi]TPX03914.1 twin-arginine translocase TatA/TatE family subunit [Schumannella luteola]
MFIHPLFWNQPWAWVVILLVVLVLFGATRLPALSKSLGQSVKIFRNEVKTDEPAGEAKSESAEPTTPADSSSAPTDKS